VIARCLIALVVAVALVPACIAHAAPARESRALLGILVRFSDQPAQTTVADWRIRLFGANESVRATLERALDVIPAAESHGAADDGVVGWLSLDRRHPDFGGTVDAEARHLAHDALVAAGRHIRFADFDTDGDGVVSPGELLVVIIVAGNEAAVGDACRPGVWAHHGEMAPVALDGVELSAYAMLGEMHCAHSSPPGAQAPAEVIAHEAAALLGLLDASDGVVPPAAAASTVVVPNGGEAWPIGSIRRIEWQSTVGGNVRVELSRDAGATWTTLFSSLVDDGAHKWTVTGPASNRARIRVCSVAAPSVCDASNANFVITRGTVTLTTPNGGETWTIGSIRRIEWASTVAGTVRIELSSDGGTSWTTLFPSLENDGAQNWTVFGPVTTRARVRACSAATPRICDSSDAAFTIGAPAVARANLVAPVMIVPSLTVIGNQPWFIGVVTANTGTGTAGPSRTDIYLSKDSTFTTSDLRMASFWVPALGPGEVNEQGKTITFPFISPGLYFAAARTDALGAVAEKDENNWFPLPSGFRVFVFSWPD
jgi:CARDB protein